jgi:hypothetical protein
MGEWALAFAKRVETDVKDDKSDDFAPHITRAYALALSRAPRRDETKAAATFIRNGVTAYGSAGKSNPRTLALADFCQTLLALNEFIYVD